ncbi:MAG: AMIN domain-containing protein [Terriglobales bacterium]
MFSVSLSRYAHFAAQILIVATLSLPLSAQLAPQHATVQRVTTREVGDAVEVEIQTSGGPVSPDTQVITGPDRIVVDFPGALPSTALRALKVNRGGLKGVRSGLFFSNPPITRIVLDLTGPRPYKISSSDHVTVVTLAGVGIDEKSTGAPTVESVPAMQKARLRDAALAARAGVAVAHMSPVSEVAPAPPSAAPQMIQPQQVAAPLETTTPPEPVQPAVSVTYENGMLRILADKATLSQVLYEVHLRTQAEIAIPAGAEQEKVVADLGPAPARVVLAQLLNGSAYNFIFVGNELSLERVILTRRAGSF